jgi:formyltetrahydrofolate deformylase
VALLSLELLRLRHRAGEIDCDICAVVSNHRDLSPVAAQFNVPFHHFAIDKDNKGEQERAQWALLDELKADLIVLARYMQILSAQFTERYPNRIINIHHSFLPAFVGGKPYHRAYERGVKLIGATAHYATGDLDEGPIIEQDVIRTSHRDSVDDLVRKGRDMEKVALARAVKWHIEDRILVYNYKTVVFG